MVILILHQKADTKIHPKAKVKMYRQIQINILQINIISPLLLRSHQIKLISLFYSQSNQKPL